MAQLISTVDMDDDFRRAEQARRTGNFALSLDLYLALISRRLTSMAESDRASALTAADLVVLERAADLALLFGYATAADDLLAGMATALESAQNLFGLDYILLKRAHLALGDGRLRDVKKLLAAMKPRIGDIGQLFSELGLEEWESRCYWGETTDQDRAVLFSRLYLVMGWLLEALGQYKQAVLTLERGLSYTRQDAPHLAQVADVQLRLCIVTARLEQGLLLDARKILAELRPTQDLKLQPGSYVRYHELSGKLDMLEGNFGGALENYYEVLSTCRSSQFESAALTAALNLANTLILLNNTSVAQNLLAGVKARALNLDYASTAARADVLISLAGKRSASIGNNVWVTPSVSVLRGQAAGYRREEVVPEEVPEISADENFLTFFEDRMLQFYWHFNNANLAQAVRASHQLRDVFGTSDSRLIQTRLNVLEGITAYYSGNWKTAGQLLSESLEPLRDMGLIPDLWQAQRVLKWCWLKLDSSKEDQEEIGRSNQSLLAGMSNSLPSDYRAIFLLNKWTDEEEFIAGEINQLVRLRNQLDESPRWKRPKRSWALQKRIYLLLRYIDRHKESLARDKPTNFDKKTGRQFPALWKLLLTHPRDRATISFLVLPDRVFIAHARWMKLEFGISNRSRIQVREAIQSWHLWVANQAPTRGEHAIAMQDDLPGAPLAEPRVAENRNLTAGISGRPPLSTTAEARRLASELAHQLQIPQLVEALPARVKSLSIVPHDSLLGFPFAAINLNGNYLLERFSLSVDFNFFRNDSRARVTTAQDALFVGVSRGSKGFSPLPGVLPEINQMVSWATARGIGYQTLINETATKQAVIECLKNSALLHMACHGVFKADQPDASGLVLITGTDEPEILNLRELSALNLGGLQLASLSSCWSADNFILPGRWIIGLPETLRRAGVSSILASLWEVDDLFAQSFNSRFYSYLNNYARDEALRRTQLDCLRNTLLDQDQQPPGPRRGIDSSDPFYWASYILYGDAGLLEPPNANANN